MARRLTRSRRTIRNPLVLLGVSFAFTFALYNGVLAARIAQVAGYPQPRGGRGVGFVPSELITPGGTSRFGAAVIETLWVEDPAALPCRVTNLTLALGGRRTIRSTAVPLTVLPDRTAAIVVGFDPPSHPHDRPADVEYDTALEAGPTHLVASPCANGAAGACGLAEGPASPNG